MTNSNAPPRCGSPTTLYAVVSDNVEMLYAAVAARFEGATVPYNPPCLEEVQHDKRH
jgi:hypothetical protein